MNQKLTLGSKFTYGLADLGFALITSAIQFFLLIYYTDVAGINPAIAGLALMVGKLTWDAINDPLFGYLSDRTRSRFGRRRIYMLIGAVPLGIAAWIMFSLPKGLTDTSAFLAVLVSFLLVDTFHTMTSVPYYAMTPELTRDYGERASLTTVRMIFSVIGYILGAVTTTILVMLFQQIGLSLQQAWSATGAVFGTIAIITILITTFSVSIIDLLRFLYERQCFSDIFRDHLPFALFHKECRSGLHIRRQGACAAEAELPAADLVGGPGRDDARLPYPPGDPIDRLDRHIPH